MHDRHIQSSGAKHSEPELFLDLEGQFKSMKVVGGPVRIDPKRPTVVFLDQFDIPGIYPNGPALFIAHGELSAHCAEQRGYNVIRLQETRKIDDSLSEIADAIKNKILPLRRGDAINVSMVASMETFESTNKLLGTHLTAKNLASRTPSLLSRLKKFAGDSSPNSDQYRLFYQDEATEALRSVASIKQIQRTGVEVVHAAGNNGPNQFDWSFLSAKTELSAADKQGKVMNWSGSNSRTKPDIGRYAVTYQRQSLFDPQPLEQQLGRYKLGDLPIFFKADALGGVHFTPFEKIEVKDQQEWRRFTETEAVEISPATWSKDITSASFGFSLPVKEPVSLIIPAYLSKSDGAVSYPYDKHPVEIASGTSFSNINYFWNSFDRLAKLKQAKAGAR